MLKAHGHIKPPRHIFFLYLFLFEFPLYSSFLASLMASWILSHLICNWQSRMAPLNVSFDVQ